LYLCWLFFLYFFDLFFLLLLPYSLYLSCVCPNYPGQQLIHIEPSFILFSLLNEILIWNLLHFFKWWLGFFDVLGELLLPHVHLTLFIEDVVALILLRVVF
jgi:hypothetical protein